MSLPQSIDARAFPITLRNARERSGLTQRELGERAGVNFSQISRYEQGVALPRPGMLLRLAKALDVDPEFLRKGDDLVYVDVVEEDGTRLPLAIPAEDMAKIYASAAAHGRSPEAEMKEAFLNGIRYLAGELVPVPENLGETIESPQRKKPPKPAKEK